MESQEGAATVAARDFVLDFSRLSLNTFNVNNVSEDRKRDTRQLFLNYNRLSSLPSSVSLFYNLEFLDISNNGLTDICEGITRLTKLKTLLAKNNRLDEFSLPKEFGSLQLEVLNFSGNRFQEIPLQCTKLLRLQSLSIGGNRLKSIPAEIEHLTRLVKKNTKKQVNSSYLSTSFVCLFYQILVGVTLLFQSMTVHYRSAAAFFIRTVHNLVSSQNRQGS